MGACRRNAPSYHLAILPRHPNRLNTLLDTPHNLGLYCRVAVLSAPRRTAHGRNAMRLRLTTLALCILVSALSAAHRSSAAPPPPDTIKELQKEYLSTVTMILDLTLARYQSGTGSIEQVM